MSDQASRSPYHHGDLRNSLLQAAEALLRTQGLEQLSLRAVARTAGVSHAAPYRHFSSKAALTDALVEHGFGRLLQQVDSAVATIPHGPEQQLVAAWSAYAQVSMEYPELWQLMQASTAGERAIAAHRDMLEMLEGIIATGMAAGVFRQRNPTELALVALGGMQGQVALIHSGQIEITAGNPAGLRQLSETFAANLLYGIAR